LQELTRLVTTLGYQVVGQVTQRRSSDRSASVLGSGKLAELAEWTDGSGVISAMVEHKLSKAALKWQKPEPEESEEDIAPGLLSDEQKGSAQIVIVDTDLSPSQLRNLESASGVTVLDRTGVIIEIFSRHARTKAARLQVEIARLTYVAPRLRETGGGEDRQGGGVGGKGAGESSLELDKRKIRDRIKELKSELASIGNEHQVRRARREQEISVALVGYTNAGKSSLMRAMTGSEVLVADKLFATLDTTIRPLHPETRPKVLLSDTVGFIKKLPHDLVASFKSTLDEALHASLLLFVVDASDPSFRSQLEVTRQVLAEVGVTDTPQLLVLNKQDQLNADQKLALIKEFPDAVFISTRSSEDLKFLRDKIMSYFESYMEDEEIFIPYAAKGVIGDIRAKMRVLQETYNENGVTLKVRSSKELLTQIKKKLS
jgi:GTP-binding protein HflX